MSAGLLRQPGGFEGFVLLAVPVDRDPRDPTLLHPTEDWTRRGSVPPASSEASEFDESDERDDHSEPDAPEDRYDDPDNHDDAAEGYPARTSAMLRCGHSCLLI